MSDFGQTPPPGELQFQHAEVLPPESVSGASSHLCVACKQPAGSPYFHAQGQVVCPLCAQRILSGQQAPPALSLVRAMLYGAVAALGGCILYATVAIVTGWEFGLVAIVVGIMVGKAVRYASNGRGGRPQQILAVILTYFAITTSYVPVFIYTAVRHPEQFAHSRAQNPDAAGAPATANPRPSVLGAIVTIVLLTAAAPFFGLTTGISGLISLLLIFFGMRQAWRLTARTELLVMGPYEAATAS